MIINLLLIVASALTSVIGIVYSIINRHNLVNRITNVLNIFIFLIMGVFFYTSFVLSTETSIREDIALIFWNSSIIFWLFSLALLCVTHRIIFKFDSNVIQSTLLYSFLIGIILGLVFLSNSFTISLNSNYYVFIFQNSIVLYCMLGYNLIMCSVLSYHLFKYYSDIRNRNSKRLLIFLTINFYLFIFLYSLYLIFQNIIIRNTYIIYYITGSLITYFTMLKKPAYFIELTNKIYDFIIFHKSGILLYSYNFETGQETDESLLKGSILIGINHILSNLINKKEQLSLIKMKNRDILLEFENTFGYAILLTTDHKNNYIDKAVSNFMKQFTYKNKEKLKNLNGLIDVSEFKNAKQMIREFFQPFFLDNN